MKFVYPVLLVVAGAVLGWIALREGESDYRAPVAEVPATLAGEPGDGQVVRAFEVEGMCCRSCSQKLYASLVAVKGVAEAAVSFDSGRAQAPDEGCTHKYRVRVDKGVVFLNLG